MKEGLGVSAAQAYHRIEEAYAEALASIGNRAERRTPQGRAKVKAAEQARKKLLTAVLTSLEQAQREMSGNAGAGAHGTPEVQ